MSRIRLEIRAAGRGFAPLLSFHCILFATDYLIRRTRVPDSPSEVSKSCDGSLRASDTLSEFSIPTIQLPPSLRPVMSSSNPSTPVKSWSPRCDDSPVSHSPSSSTMSSPISLTPTLSLEFPSASDKTIELYDNCAKIGAFMASVWPQVVKKYENVCPLSF